MFSATSLALWLIFSDGTTEQHVIIAGFGELAAVSNDNLVNLAKPVPECQTILDYDAARDDWA